MLVACLRGANSPIYNSSALMYQIDHILDTFAPELIRLRPKLNNYIYDLAQLGLSV